MTDRNSHETRASVGTERCEWVRHKYKHNDGFFHMTECGYAYGGPHGENCHYCKRRITVRDGKEGE